MLDNLDLRRFRRIPEEQTREVRHIAGRDFVVALMHWEWFRTIGGDYGLLSGIDGITQWRRRRAAHRTIYGVDDFAGQGGPASGIYGDKNQKTLEMGLRIAPNGRDVVGLTALWGDMTENENIYRAEYGYPVLIYAQDGRIAESLERYYDVPARLFAPETLPDLERMKENVDMPESVTAVAKNYK